VLSGVNDLGELTVPGFLNQNSAGFRSRAHRGIIRSYIFFVKRSPSIRNGD
jgi:hypothetical protein